MLFQATHDSISNLPKKQILMQNWPQIKQEIPSDRPVYAVIIHLEGYYSLVLAFGQDVVDAIVHKLHCRIQEQVCHHSQFAVIDFEWNKEKAVVLDSLDICLLYVCKEDETNINRTFDQYHRLLSEPYDYNGLSLDMNLTIGIQQVDLSEAISTSIRRAQVASKEASQRKINLLQYEHKTGHDPAYTSMLLAKFKQAIGTDAIFLVYQPQINVTTGSLFGVEALIRWKDDELGWISPCEFIPIIEQSSLINQLSEFVIYEACCFYSRYLSRFNAPIQLSINLSARNITDKNLIQFVSKTLDTLDVPAKCITFELTETAFLGDIATSRDMFNKLLDLGVNIALDDFGVGYSSLVYLKELPFSELKIDKGFLLNNSGTKQDVGFLKAAIQIGQSLDMLVIAEGVETLQMAQHLKQLGCELCQGYYFARPMTEVAFFEWCLDYKQQPNRIGLEHVDA
jgi:EAL domain-containing protein (putative c-di-GMP-specific phosphodiesterase class I)